MSSCDSLVWRFGRKFFTRNGERLQNPRQFLIKKSTVEYIYFGVASNSSISTLQSIVFRKKIQRWTMKKEPPLVDLWPSLIPLGVSPLVEPTIPSWDGIYLVWFFPLSKFMSVAWIPICWTHPETSDIFKIPDIAIWSQIKKRKHPSLKSLLLLGLLCWDRRDALHLFTLRLHFSIEHCWRWKYLVSSTNGISWGMHFIANSSLTNSINLLKTLACFGGKPTRWQRSPASVSVRLAVFTQQKKNYQMTSYWDGEGR